MLKGARYARSLCISKLKQNPPFIVRCSAHLLNLLCHDIITVLGAKVIIKQAGNLSGFFRRAGEENCGLPKKMATMTMSDGIRLMNFLTVLLLIVTISKSMLGERN